MHASRKSSPKAKITSTANRAAIVCTKADLEPHIQYVAPAVREAQAKPTKKQKSRDNHKERLFIKGVL